MNNSKIIKNSYSGAREILQVVFRDCNVEHAIEEAAVLYVKHEIDKYVKHEIDNYVNNGISCTVDSEKNIVDDNKFDRRKLLDSLIYYCWYKESEIDESFILTSTYEIYKKFLAETEYHFGDCTRQSISCCRCLLQGCEIEAQQLFDYMKLDKITQ